MHKKIVMGMLLVAMACALAALGYRFGRYLAQADDAGQASVDASARSAGRAR